METEHESTGADAVRAFRDFLELGLRIGPPPSETYRCACCKNLGRFADMLLGGWTLNPMDNSCLCPMCRYAYGQGTLSEAYALLVDDFRMKMAAQGDGLREAFGRPGVFLGRTARDVAARRVEKSEKERTLSEKKKDARPKEVEKRVKATMSQMQRRKRRR